MRISTNYIIFHIKGYKRTTITTKKCFNLKQNLGVIWVSKKCAMINVCSDIIQDLVKKVHISETLLPHPFAEIVFKHRAMSTVLSFVSLLRVFPWVLYVLCVSTSLRVSKIVFVVHLWWGNSFLMIFLQ